VRQMSLDGFPNSRLRIDHQNAIGHFNRQHESP
jgi:hypothetical protein